MRRGMLVVFLAVAVAVPSFAEITVGNLTANAFGYVAYTPPLTIVDLAHPATTAGTVGAVTVRWIGTTSGGCGPTTFKVKFVRPATNPFGTYSLVAERGPFPAPANDAYVVVQFAPVTIAKGDLLAITELGPGTSCGNVEYTAAPDSVTLLFNSDLPATGSMNGGMRFSGTLLARASTDTSVLDGVVAAVGSVAGNNGSFFRTSLQITNPESAVRLAGKLVFHPQGVSASASDPSITYNLAPSATVSYPDIIAALNASGLGSLDLVTIGSAAPIVNVRIFNDQGAAGTNGFTEPLLPPGAALTTLERGYFALAPDLTNFRMNVGIRTFDDGAEILVQQFDPVAGTLISSTTKTYGENYFEQVGLSTFLGATPVPGATGRVIPTAGTIIVYLSTTDNRTNDSSVFFVRRP